MVEAQPPGFRFYPTEEELVLFYLHNKLEGTREDLNHLMERIIPVVNIYDYNPWDLPKFSQYLCHRDAEQWFFFVPRQESEARGGKPNRLTSAGYWKATGTLGFVYSSNRAVGEKRTMVFYRGRAPNGRKTEWKMNEYKSIEGESSASTSTGATLQVRPGLFSLCRVYKQSKCLRTFDRRPLPVVIISEPTAQQVAHHGDDHLPHQAGTSYDHQAFQMAAAERTTSPECLSSVDVNGGQPYQNEAISNVVMISNNEPWWDVEQLDLFRELSNG